MNYYEAWRQLPAKYRQKLSRAQHAIVTQNCCAAAEASISGANYYGNRLDGTGCVERCIAQAINNNRIFLVFYLPRTARTYEQAKECLKRLPAVKHVGVGRNRNTGNVIDVFFLNLLKEW